MQARKGRKCVMFIYPHETLVIDIYGDRKFTYKLALNTNLLN